MADATLRAPHDQVIEADMEPIATDVEVTKAIGEVDQAGYVNEVVYTPRANITGVATNNRKLALVNKGADGNGTTEVAAITFDTGINANDFDEVSLTLSVVAGARTVAAGEILAWASTAPGTGLADPGGHIEVRIGRQQT